MRRWVVLVLLAACSVGATPVVDVTVVAVDPPPSVVTVTTQPPSTTVLVIEVLPIPVTTTLAPTTQAPTTQTTYAPTTGVPPTTVPPPVPLPPVTTVEVFSPITEAAFVVLMNDERVRRGVPLLVPDTGLRTYARNWALEMVFSGFRHSNIESLLGPWWIAGENIGRGGTTASIFAALLGSEFHYNNIIDPRFTHLGVGVFIDSSGTIWTVHVFAG